MMTKKTDAEKDYFYVFRSLGYTLDSLRKGGIYK